MEDKRYLEVLGEIGVELDRNIVEYNRRMNGSSDMPKEEAVAIRLAQNDALADMIKKHRRHLLYIIGEPVEPEVQFGESVLFPVGGLA